VRAIKGDAVVYARALGAELYETAIAAVPLARFVRRPPAVRHDDAVVAAWCLQCDQKAQFLRTSASCALVLA